MFLSFREAEEGEGFEFEMCKIKLGSGSSGTVFLAQHPQTHELVAVKRLFARDTMEGGGYFLPCAPRDINCHHHLDTDCASTFTTSGMATTISPRSDHSSAQSNVKDDGSTNNYNDTMCEGSDSNYKEERDTEREDAECYMKENLKSFSTGMSASRALPLPCECAILQSLDPHHHIVKFFGSYTTSRRVTFIAMQLMDSDVGKELRALNTAFMNEDIIRPLIYSIVSAIAHLHRCGIVHRDIKPSNILLRCVDGGERIITTAPGKKGNSNNTKVTRQSQHISLGEKKQVKAALGDFSAAHFIHEASYIGSRRGTLYYKAPEQLMGRAEDFFACDMWALGCTMFELVTGFVAFCGSTDLQVLHQIYAKLGTSFQSYPTRVSEVTLFDGILEPSPIFLNFLKDLLALDPRERLTANEALKHAFFDPIRQKYGTHSENIEVTFPLCLQCCRYVDTTQLTFRPITNTFSKPSMVAIPGGSSHIQYDVNTLDASFSCSGKKCSMWSLSFSVSPSPLPLSARQGSNYESIDASRRRSRISSGWGTCNAARRLSVSSCTPKKCRDTTQEKEDISKTTAQVISPVTLSFSPATSAKCYGNAVTTANTAPHGRVLLCASSSSITIGNLRTNNIFERTVMCRERTVCTSPVGPPVSFEDDTNSCHNDTDLLQVRKMLFTAPEESSFCSCLK